jgi:hypothetical protein
MSRNYGEFDKTAIHKEYQEVETVPIELSIQIDSQNCEFSLKVCRNKKIY